MSNRDVADLIVIAQYGGGFELDASDYTPADLATVASRMCFGSTMKIRNADDWSTEDLGALAQSAPPGVVVYVF